MSSRIETNKTFLRSLYLRESPRHGVIDGAPSIQPWQYGDYICSSKPIKHFLPWVVTNYKKMLDVHNAIPDDSVPYASLLSNTGLFAAAFGCPLVECPESNAMAVAIISDPQEADAINTPGLDAEPIARCLELAALVRSELGSDVPIGVPDIQSPFDIAALIWRKEDLYTALVEAPDSVTGLIQKCENLLTTFLSEFKNVTGECNYAHFPPVWAPYDLGCWLSEDEVGAISGRMFQRFCLQPLARLSERFGGIFIHCCADADHQYENFLNVPQLRGMNRGFVHSSMEKGIQTLGKHLCMIQNVSLYDIDMYLKAAEPNTLFLFQITDAMYNENLSLDELRRIHDEIAARCLTAV